ncbi:MAG: STAS domain-containing protein [Oscillospiraceae bacterium]|nr:STAS domain-containing protein [Oscillospiraceae bacterium]
MNITATNVESENKVVLVLEGRLDSITAPTLQQAIAEPISAAQNVDLDFMDLKYVSSAGLRVLLIGEKSAKNKDVKMRIINVSDGIMEVFKLTGFSKVLNVVGV